MCGEMAADLEATPILLGLGLPEFSASPSAIPALKQRIGQLTSAQARQIAADVRDLATAEEVHAYVAQAVQLRGAERKIEVARAH
jgi:phosphocarrier protein FPr